MGLRELKRALRTINPGTPVSVKYESRLGPDEAVGRYHSENGYRLFLKFGQNPDAPAGSGHVSLGSVSEVSMLQVNPRVVYQK